MERRRALAARYAELLSGIPGLVLPVEPAWARSNWQSYCVRLPEHCDQRRVMQRMLDRGVSTRRGIMCAHREPAYAVEPWRCTHSLPESERAQDRSIVLPLFVEMSDAEQQAVAAALLESTEEEHAG